METLAEIEEALTHVSAVPSDQRGAAWESYLNALLDKRKHLARTDAQRRETRVVAFSEVR
jgi:hypothetical protein